MPDISDVFMQNSNTPARARSRTAAAELVMKGLSEGITDPEELKRLSGIKRSADLMVTMDRLSLRREFHEAMYRAGLTPDKLMTTLSDHVDSTDAKVSIKAVEVTLKMLSMFRPESSSGDVKSWEEIVLEKATAIQEGDMKQISQPVYDVKIPEVPPDMAEMAEQVRNEGRSIGSSDGEETV